MITGREVTLRIFLTLGRIILGSEDVAPRLIIIREFSREFDIKCSGLSVSVLAQKGR